MRILKFGGSSVRDAERIKNVIKIVKKALSRDKVCGVVFSAYQGVTDNLIRISRDAASEQESYFDDFLKLKERHINTLNELLKGKLLEQAIETINKMFHELEQVLRGVYLIGDLSPKISDFILSFGELLSNQSISFAFSANKVDNDFLDTRQVIRTDRNFGDARVLFEETNKNIVSYFEKHNKLQIITGFIALTQKNETTTLGRGGSDFTVSIIGAALKVDEIEIWTDVSGVLSADPKKVRDAFPIRNMNYEETMELSHFGAKVIYPPTVQPASNLKIPIVIKNTFDSDAPGTTIGTKTDSDFPIKGISSIDDIAIIRVVGSGMIGITGIAHRLFAALHKRSITIILVTQASSEHSICLAILPTFAEEAKECLDEEFHYELKSNLINEIIIESGFSIIAVVGKHMAHTPGIAAKFFGALGDNNINIIAIAQGSSELNISAVIPKNDELKALNVIHHKFFSSGKPEIIHLFLTGYGSVATTLMGLISKNNDLYHRIRLHGLINTKKMIIGRNEISPKNLKEQLEQSNTEASLDEFINKISTLDLPNSVLVDCSASEIVANKLIDVLRKSIHVVAANKKATTQSFEYYQLLKETAKANNVKFLFETNVGAALPVVSTLNDLMRAGDKIVKIEGVLSGTLSFIFNNLSGDKKFSDLVLEAKKEGYTEPDVREDLSGTDAARKLLVLIRESHRKMEMSDIKVENLVPAKYRKIKSADEFIKLLPELDEYFEQRVIRAEIEGKVLRYIASYAEGKATVSLQEVDKKHPAYNLSGTDNIIAYYTEYYNTTPHVVNGPGAGKQITAVGIISDIFKIFG